MPLIKKKVKPKTQSPVKRVTKTTSAPKPVNTWKRIQTAEGWERENKPSI